MAFRFVRHFNGPVFKLGLILSVLILSILPADLSEAHSNSSKRSNSSSERERNIRKKSYHRYAKNYDDSNLKKWMENYRKYGRKPAQVPPTVPAGYCPIPFEKKVTAVKVRGHHIYLDLNDLAFLKNAGFILNEADFELVIQGKHQQQESVEFSLNGLKVSYPGRQKLNEFMQYFKESDSSRAHFKLQKLSINGSESFDRYLARIKKNHGLIKISLFGRLYKIISASVTFKGTAYNPCGNPTPTPGPSPTPNPPPEDLTQYAVKIDSTQPSQSPTNSTNMVINFSSIKSDGTYWCSLDNSAFTKCDSPLSYAGLISGSHNFQVFATTPKGVDGAKASFSWAVDNTRPVVTITNLAQLETLTNSSQISFDFTSSKPGTFRCDLDGQVLLSCQSPQTYNVSGDGLHSFSVTAVDNLGNVSGLPASFQWTLDTQAPLANFIDISPLDEVSANSTRNFTFGSNETANFECSLDSGAFIECSSPFVLSQLPEGSHLLALRATDLAGNVSSAVTHNWISDFSPPVLAKGAVSPMTGLTNSQNISAEFFVNEPAQFFCQFDGEIASGCTSPFVRSQLSEGAHSLAVYAIDRAGLRSTDLNFSWIVDLTAPMISFGEILPSAASSINSAQISLVVNSSESLSLNASLNGVPISLSSNLISLNLGEGNYIIQASGYDSAGNLSNTISHSFSIDLTAPLLNLSSPGSNLSNQNFRSFNFSANELVTFECSLDDAGFTPCQSGQMYSGLADGDHHFVLRGTDSAGNATLSSFDWSQDATAPSTFQSNFLSGTTITFNLSSSESNVNYLCSLDGVPISPCNAVITYSELSIGDHLFLARSVDQAGNVDPIGANFGFTILAPIHTIITNGNPPGEIVNSNQMTISFTADQPASGFLCSLDGAARSSCVSAVTYTNLAQGSHTVVINAIDQFGVMDPVGATKTWIVDSIAPVVSNMTTTVTTNSITVSWTTSEPATGRVNFGVGSALNQNSAEVTTFDTVHSIRLTGLSSNTSYSVRVLGKDAAGNSFISNIITVRTNR